MIKEQISNIPSEKLRALREKIKNMADENLKNINPENLDEEDAEIFKKFENGVLTKMEYDGYKQQAPESRTKSWLMGYLGGQIMLKQDLMERWSREPDKKKE